MRRRIHTRRHPGPVCVDRVAERSPAPTASANSPARNRSQNKIEAGH
ncbi:hypothetical protein BURPS1710A_1666 [Burkholderia pseudomallei 1710a]|uniref:Uncharacterized protein n=1 Tax=Burkholderia pseudomallei 1710a TaxID=320371 RepID=A0A0E1W254_BURPE|nr:hypothetical protein BURPS1710A_1666 [Burkholderia pseudomallei 1710a]